MKLVTRSVFFACAVLLCARASLAQTLSCDTEQNGTTAKITCTICPGEQGDFNNSVSDDPDIVSVLSSTKSDVKVGGQDCGKIIVQVKKKMAGSTTVIVSVGSGETGINNVTTYDLTDELFTLSIDDGVGFGELGTSVISAGGGSVATIKIVDTITGFDNLTATGLASVSLIGSGAFEFEGGGTIKTIDFVAGQATVAINSVGAVAGETAFFEVTDDDSVESVQGADVLHTARIRLVNATIPTVSVTVGTWLLDEALDSAVVLDSSGSPIVHDGTLASEPNKPVRGVSDNPHSGGGFGNFLSFDGDDLVTISANGSPELSLGDSDFTIEFWIRQSADQFSASAAMDVMGAFTTGAGWAITAAGGSMVFHIRGDDGNFSLSTLSFGTGGPLPSREANKWYHFAVVHSGADYTLYLTPAGGLTQIVGFTGIGDPNSATEDLILGDGSTGGLRFQGDLDQVRITTRALTPDEFFLSAPSPPALAGDDTFISVLGCGLTDATFETNEDVTVDGVTVTITGNDPAPGVTVTPGSQQVQVSLDAALPIYRWLQLDVDVTGVTSDLSATLTVYMVHTPLDVNGDGRTNIQDATAFGAEFNGGKDPNLIDENCDGIVNILDATAFGARWNDDANGAGPLPDKPLPWDVIFAAHVIPGTNFTQCDGDCVIVLRQGGNRIKCRPVSCPQGCSCQVFRRIRVGWDGDFEHVGRGDRNDGHPRNNARYAYRCWCVK